MRTQTDAAARLIVFSILSVALIAAVGLAQPRASEIRPPRPAFDYVGVGDSLVRVDRDSGKVEILEQRDSPGLTLTIEQAKPWSWREIRVDNRPRPGVRGARKAERGENESEE